MARVTLPAVVFGAFSAIRIDLSALVVFVAIFGSCLIALGLGLDALQKRWSMRPFLMTAMEVGMLGYPLFTIVFGAANLPPPRDGRPRRNRVHLHDPHPLLNQRNGGPAGLKPALMRLVTNPVIWAAFLGIASALAGIGAYLGANPGGRTFLSCLSFIGAPTGALILFVIGYDMDFSLKSLGKAMTTIALRYLIMVPLFFAAWALVKRFAPSSAEPVLRSALMVLFTMPSTFAIPIFGREGEESEYISATLSLNTLVTVCLLAAVTLMGK